MATTGEPIGVLNRYTGATERESIYGERWLRWTYETGVGRLVLALLVRRMWFSRWYGWRMSRPGSRARVAPFIAKYGLDAGEFAETPEHYASFNDFFSRRLKPAARPLCASPDAVVFPADGRHLGLADVSATDRFYVKGQRFDLARFLGSEDVARKFSGGSMVISRLCPVDYHRFHFPCAGNVNVPRFIHGPLYSVSPVALRHSLAYLWENKRAITLIESAIFGAVAVVEIGATCVGTIVHTSVPGRVEKGAEKGYFRFGGSCVVTLFEHGRVQLDDDLVLQSRQSRELYARMGDRMGIAVK